MTLNRQFKSGKFDQGLLRRRRFWKGALARPRRPTESASSSGDARSQARKGPGCEIRPGHPLAIGLGIFGVFVLIRVFSAAFGRGRRLRLAGWAWAACPGLVWVPGPGYGPGYGRRLWTLRGGFFSGMLGRARRRPLLETGFMTSSRAATGATGRAMLPHIRLADSGPPDRGGDDFVGRER